MTSHHELPPEESIEQPEPHALLKDAWSKLFSRKVRVIYDETSPGSRLQAGIRRTDLTIAGGNLGVARYNSDYARQLAGLLENEVTLAPGENLIGQISFSKQLPTAGIEGSVYLTTNERANGFLNIDIARWKALSSDSQDCFEFAERIGLGSHWFRSMIEAEAANEPYHDYQLIDLKGPSQLQLYSALSEVQFT
jgi:hypothetical protein